MTYREEQIGDCTRALTLRRKVKVEKMPAIYVDVEHDGMGNVLGIQISEPGKFDNTAVGAMVRSAV